MTCIRVINPNTSASMTDAVVAQVRARVPAGVEVLGLTATHGAPVIDSPETFAAATRQVPAMAGGQPSGASWLLACFGDPGLEALRIAVAPDPVAGLAETAMAEAVSRGLRFAILTAGPTWVAMLTQRVGDFGAAKSLTGVFALSVNGRELAADPERFRSLLREAARQAQAAGAEALILGGAAFAGIAGLVETELPVIDPIDAATDVLLRPIR